MPDSLVVQQANAYRAALLRRESTQMRGMMRQWATVERNLQHSIANVLDEIQQRIDSGEMLNRDTGPYVRLRRYQELLAQTRTELASYADYAEGSINQGIAANVDIGTMNATALAEASGGPGAVGAFNRLPVAVTERMAGTLQADAAVGQLLRGAWPEAVVQMTDALVNGTALGWNPRKTAKAMVDGLQKTALQRSLVISRTESLRAYRTSSLETYRQSGVVRGYKRLAAKGPRTCIACLMEDGKFYELDVEFATHPQCRCTSIAWVQFADEPTWEGGEQWFLKQPEATQRSILGPGAYNAWKGGAITLPDLVAKHEHPTWGPSLGVASLRSVLGDGAREFYAQRGNA